MRAAAAFAFLALTACGDDAAPAPSLGPDGLAPFRVGMTLEEVRAVPGVSVPDDIAQEACFFIAADDASSLFLMMQDGALQRMDARKSSVPLEHGLRVGDPVDKVHAAYGDKVDVQPHKYEYESGAQYLTVFTPDKQRAIRYVTAAGKIASAQAGNAEAVQLVEGCG